ncbi:YhcN/YlaJ family sporulation lipoprotein [Brevibacillus massiliensis]|uniref:YhcN/YlaJ family sporulation lipoprotein n=1 Tax=Brevibacillus massiliensis TaxID=1118054 RepID=UPI00030AC10D|nr:YhcN/YlaJ family sporulation lipoprotein [Brevibacillus massiliensis]
MRIKPLILSLFVLLTGCAAQSNQQTKAASAAECKETPVRHFHVEKTVKSIVEQVPGVDDAVAVQIDKELHVGIKISNFNRLRFKSIEKNTAKKLKEAFPKSNIHISSDKAIINELQMLSNTPWSSKREDACKQKKQMKDIEDRMKG